MAISDRYQGFVVDLDGVVFEGDEPLREAVGFLKRARRAKRPVVFATNNSTQTPNEWIERFQEAKVKVSPDHVVTSATATAALLSAEPPPRCFVIGEPGLIAALLEAGIQIVEEPGHADTVVVGWDGYLTYEKLAGAASAIRRGARFVGTNPDVVLPSPDGPVPGNGATLAYLRAATNVAPEVVGKPQASLFELARERLDVDGAVLVVGDQVETDLAAAAKMGWDTALALSGLSTWSSLIGCKHPPTWVVPHLGALDGPEPPVIRHARESEVSAIRALLDECGLDSAGVARRLRDTLVAVGPDERVVGTISWELAETAAHLHALAVTEAERGHGTGSHLIVRALADLADTDAEWVYLLTPGADELFERLGFWKVHRDRVPEPIRASAELDGAAASGGALVRRLR